MSNSMKIKIRNKFTNPLTGRRAEVDEEFNVPKNQFWLKRLQQKDCELVKRKAKARKPEKDSGKKADVKNKSKGSK